MENDMRKSKYESPLRYPGGKVCIYPFISNLLYENNLIGTEYAEPYAGGAGLALKLLFNEYVSEIHINDLDKSIYVLWKNFRDNNVRFCDWVEDVKINIENWEYFKFIQQNPRDFDDFELAKSTFYLNRTNVSGVIKGGVIGGKDQKGKYKIDVRFNKNDLIKRIHRISAFKERINISNMDGISFIRKMNKKVGDVFIYLDPPYFQKGADLYMNFYNQKDHSKLAKNVDLIEKKWLVSYDNHEFILNLYQQQRKLIYKLSQSTSNRIGDEILVFSDKLKFEKSANKLKSPIQI
jgi:DNA adenine methylase